MLGQPEVTSSRTIRKTFVELCTEEEETPGLRRSSSDSEISDSSSGPSGDNPWDSKGDRDPCLLDRNSSGNSNASLSGLPLSQSNPGATHLTWNSSSEGSEGLPATVVADAVDTCGIDLEAAMALHKKMWDLSTDPDLRDVLSKHFPGMVHRMDISVYVPRDLKTGRPLSLGSTHHPIGTCQRSYFVVRGSCRKGIDCLYCHAAHEEKLVRERSSGRRKYNLRINKRGSDKAAGVSSSNCPQNGECMNVSDGKKGAVPLGYSPNQPYQVETRHSNRAGPQVAPARNPSQAGSPPKPFLPTRISL
eukprot:gnl/MRDRNA2_/MRDRNA2_85714_c0_seq2.p1 gnl/MRDRNA2_/MRDRNA2_85714_c0~~gnl/MRDRNA2_/MRDRNA2_85714_c0_seq2.p1  ORF type:complete len:304 (+),score=28.88 gnl/MRDRNA2_/MRDRNA2_85714_c0_seq2:68-979(+)